MALGADGVTIYNGLWGFNSFDAALAIAGVFYVLTDRDRMNSVPFPARLDPAAARRGQRPDHTGAYCRPAGLRDPPDHPNGGFR